ncbi:TcpQ domain-containing protein [Bordetella genomosp. 8]|nr:TcpQ domain-containing protein [Bordetella genomosp. 8]
MHRVFKTFILLPWLSACTAPWAPGGGMADWNAAASTDSSAYSSTAATHDFNWRLSGDRQVAPLQVFDDGRQTWLQFAPGQPVPALFTEQHGAERPARYVRHEPYVIVQGKWPAVVMRGGALQARADYLGVARHAEATPAAMMAATAALPALGAQSAAKAGAKAGTKAGTNTTTGATKIVPSGAGLYRVGPADENIRRALARWAGLAGWTFQAEHWAVDVDIPLAGSADFSDDFKRSVRELVAATELGDRPLQPCFYANQVLRVIPLSQACDRTAMRLGTAI